MSKEEGDIWRELKKRSTEKKQSNKEWSLAFLNRNGIVYQTLDAYIGHYRVDDFDFWPATGKYYNRKTKKRGRGVKQLLKILTNIKQTNK